jgi:uncharacterized protein (DUF58 family)
MRFIFARRFYWLLLLGLIPLSFSWLSPLVVWATGIYDGLLILAVVMDYVLSEKPAQISLERITGQYLSLDAQNLVKLLVANRSDRLLTMLVRDEYPIGMALADSERELALTVQPKHMVEARYFLIPASRGDFQFGRTVVRYLGRWQLIWRQAEYETRQTVRVYPNFRQAKTIELYAHRHREMLAGLKRQRYRGHGREFESLREFVQGDELRHVSWTATARRGKLVTRQYQVERNQNVIIMLDAGRMMKAQIDRLSKLDHAINAALSIAYVALTGGDNVGLMIFARQVKRYVPPRHRPGQLNVLLDSLYNVQAELIEPNYARAIQEFTTRNTKRSLVIILTDIIDRRASAELLAHVSLLAPRHLPLVVTISDTDLRGLVGRVPATLSDVYEQSVAEELLSERQEALTFITNHGGLALDVPVGNLAVELVNQYLEIKEQGLL